MFCLWCSQFGVQGSEFKVERSSLYLLENPAYARFNFWRLQIKLRLNADGCDILFLAPSFPRFHLSIILFLHYASFIISSFFTVSRSSSFVSSILIPLPSVYFLAWLKSVYIRSGRSLFSTASTALSPNTKVTENIFCFGEKKKRLHFLSSAFLVYPDFLV